ncbi:MAG TPA: ATP-binding cassette domain-containing protein [Gaiellaceae bacterium]|nr:ATP-binding cassette domain-containing protein [Gaiellaceae bacterium]
MIDVTSLTKRFGETLAVDDLSFRVEPARVTGFLGPNGAGKTTTMRAVLGLVRPTSGSATVLGRRFRDLDQPAHRVGAVLEATSFHPGRSGRNHLRVIATEAGIPFARVEEVLALVELQDAARRRTGGYSLGMRQRLALAAALLGDPEVLVLDEPANGLDPAGVRWLRDLLRTLAERGRTILVSSHILSEVEVIADEIVIIHHGRFVASGTTQELVARASGGVRVRSPAAARLRDLLVARGAEVTEADGSLVITGMAQEAIGDLAAENGIALHELAAERASLEQAFFELTEGAA